jgi:hypothetical protein
MTTPFIPDVTKWKYRHVHVPQSRVLPLFRTSRPTGEWMLDTPAPLNHYARFVTKAWMPIIDMMVYEHHIIVFNDAMKFGSHKPRAKYIVYTWQTDKWHGAYVPSMSLHTFNEIRDDVMILVREISPNAMTYDDYQREVTA